MSIRANEHIRSIDPYQPGLPLEELEQARGIVGAIKLASNENPLGPSKQALAVLRKGIRSIHRYPEGTGRILREALAGRFKVSSDQVILGNGSDEIMDIACKIYLTPGDQVVVADPTFSIYGISARAHAGKVVPVPLSDGRYDLETMLRCISPRTRLIFICNPNNPTGTMVSHEELQQFLKQIPETIMVVIDEAYADYATDPGFPDSVRLLQTGASLIVLRTFSKFYALAGLRIGYGLSHKDVIRDFNRVRMPFNTNGLAQRAAVAALEDEQHARRTLSTNQAGRSILYKAFRRMGLRTLPSQSNFIYLDVGRLSRSVYDKLLDEGVIVRPYEGSWMRVGIGLPRENRRFIAALKKVLNDSP